MKHIVLSCSIALLTLGTHAQTTNMATTRVEMDRFMIDANGRILKPSGDYSVEGTPFLSKEFLPGSVMLGNGNTYSGLQLNINFHTNEVIFLDKDGNEMVVAYPVKKVTLNAPDGTRIFQSGYTSIDDHDITSFYEVLDSGNISLLKYTEVKYSERQPYPNAKAVRTYRDKVLYYTAKGTELQRLPKSSEDIPMLFKGKEAQLSEWVRKEKLKLKKEDDMVQLFRHANKL